MSEPFGPEYVRPAQADCPNCPCCTAPLCERGRANWMECEGLTGGPRAAVRGCPCSGRRTPGTMAWRHGRLLAAKRAAELPFAPNYEAVLQAAAAGTPVDPASPEAEALGLIHFLAPGPDGGGLVLTEFGRVYLLGREHAQYQSPLHVVSVDEELRTVQVLVMAWSEETAVTLPVDQLLSVVGGGKLSMLPGMRLLCSANAWAENADDVIVTTVMVPPAAEVLPADPAPLAAPVVPAPEPVPAVVDQVAVAVGQAPAVEPVAAAVPPRPPFPPVVDGIAPPPGAHMPGRFVRVEAAEDPRV
ncbi:hypothetical protein ACFY0G_02005 [Streptomyces sp. NPDC001552]|uniref:hypothetical protein n=1 Tax=Streptomyces sp. NPDC001552 TaxID=3364587 RepID=UPI0036D131A1